jgi:hypothetical protein
VVLALQLQQLSGQLQRLQQQLVMKILSKA